MKVYLFFLLFFTLSFAVEPHTIQAYKKAQKALDIASSKEINNAVKNIIITFKQRPTIENTLSQKYPLRLKKCIVKRVCFFEITQTVTKKTFFQTLQNAYPQIETIQEEKKRGFSRY